MVREFVRKLKTAMRAMRALMSGVASAALVAVRGIDGAVSWIWQTISGPPQVDVPEIVDDYVDVPAPLAHSDLDDASAIHVGEQVLRAAREMIRTGDVRDTSVDPVIGNWIKSLDHDSLWTVSNASALAAGRHAVGLEPLRNPEGMELRLPEPRADVERVVTRRRQREEKAQVERAALERWSLEHAESQPIPPQMKAALSL